MKTCFSLLAIGLLLLLSVPAQQPSSPGPIVFGKITATNPNTTLGPFTIEYIPLSKGAAKQIRRVTTDSNGEFSIEEIPLGRYRIIATGEIKTDPNGAPQKVRLQVVDQQGQARGKDRNTLIELVATLKAPRLAVVTSASPDTIDPRPVERPKKAAMPKPANPPPPVQSTPPQAAATPAATASPAPQTEEAALMEKYRNNFKEGRIAFNPPKEMEVDKTETFEVRLTAQEQTEALTKGLGSASSKPQVEKLKVGANVKVTLSGSEENFKIAAVTPEDRFLDPERPFEPWKWYVTPRKPGNHDVNITVQARIGDKPFYVNTYNQTIQVKVTSGSVAEWMMRHWQWIIGTLVLPLSGWLWVLFSKRREARKKDSA